jgi:hypothetical protein
MKWLNLNILILIVVKCRGCKMLELKASFYAKNLLDGGDAGSAELTGAGGIMLSQDSPRLPLLVSTPRINTPVGLVT